ncbi:MAG: 1-acyl-sn-glycerol-3-phosphate acyltransferase, partial [Planctomycetia bacterium]|nr:1-acyl-sn-glycerol-3-phosphate acyltransferase [Planctomycetia bacterium]
LLAGRVVHWMVAAEYFPLPVVGNVLRFTGSIPARRGGIDTASTRQAIRYARQGELVGMLPEGRINETPVLMLPGRPGAVLVALKARVPIIPCYLHGARYAGTFWSSMVMPAKVRLTIGPPLDLSEYFDQEPTADLLGLLTRRMMSEIAKLAGRPDFEPQLAGRHWKPKPGSTDRL